MHPCQLRHKRENAEFLYSIQHRNAYFWARKLLSVPWSPFLAMNDWTIHNHYFSFFAFSQVIANWIDCFSVGSSWTAMAERGRRETRLRQTEDRVSQGMEDQRQVVQVYPPNPNGRDLCLLNLDWWRMSYFFSNSPVVRILTICSKSKFTTSTWLWYPVWCVTMVQTPFHVLKNIRTLVVSTPHLTACTSDLSVKAVRAQLYHWLWR